GFGRNLGAFAGPMGIVGEVAVLEQREQVDITNSGVRAGVRFHGDGDDDEANSTYGKLFAEVADGGAGFGEVDWFDEIAYILFVEEPAVGGGNRLFTGVAEDAEEERLDERARLIGPWNEKAGR